MIVMIPNVSEAYALGQYDLVKKRVRQAILITFGYGVPAVMIMYYFAYPLTQLFLTHLKQPSTCSCYGLTSYATCSSCRFKRV